MAFVRFVVRSFALAILAASLLPTTSLLAATANPIPFLNQPLVPGSAEPGSAGFTLTVNGAGFVPTSVVRWNGVSLPTTYISVDQLQATVPASDLASKGTANVTISSPAPGGGTSSPVPFAIRIPASEIAFATSAITAGLTPVGVVAADFNGDGKADLAVVNLNQTDPTCYRYGTGTISIFLGNGNGTFSNRSTLCFPDLQDISASSNLLVGDFNGDGKTDLIAFYEDQGGAYAIPFLGNGDGTFVSAPVFNLDAVSSNGKVAGDFNRDGKLDFAFTADYGGPTGVSVLCGNGNGTFGTGCRGGDFASDSPIATGDFNHDGILDLALLRNSGLVIALGNGDGTFTPMPLQPLSFVNPSAMTAGDFNGDGKLDLAVADIGTTVLTVLTGNGDGTFTQVSPEPALPNFTGFLTTADFNGDGKLDLVIAGGYSISIFLGAGDGTFEPWFTQAMVIPSQGLAVADFNGDGLLDLALTNTSDNTVSILLQKAAPSGVSIALASSLNPSYVGQPVTFIALVTDSKEVPTGSVTFKAGGKVLGTAPLTDGLAVFTTTFAEFGDPLIFADYSGDQSLPAKDSVPVRQTIYQYTTQSVLSSNPNPSTHGQAVTFTVQVNSSGPEATGKVVFKNGKTSIGSAELVNGTATLVTSKLPEGSLSITATYAGTAECAGSMSNTLVQVVN